MVKGHVNPYGEPFVEIALVLKEGLKNVDAVVDTGFNGMISVPHSWIAKSDWTFVGYEEYEIATGETVRQKVFLGDLDFDGRPMKAYILASSAKDILIGTKLLGEKTLEIDFPRKSVKISWYGIRIHVKFELEDDPHTGVNEDNKIIEIFKPYLDRNFNQ